MLAKPLFVLWVFFMTPTGELPYPTAGYYSEAECHQKLEAAKHEYAQVPGLKLRLACLATAHI